MSFAVAQHYCLGQWSAYFNTYYRPAVRLRHSRLYARRKCERGIRYTRARSGRLSLSLMGHCQIGTGFGCGVDNSIRLRKWWMDGRLPVYRIGCCWLRKIRCCCWKYSHWVACDWRLSRVVDCEHTSRTHLYDQTFATISEELDCRSDDDDDDDMAVLKWPRRWAKLVAHAVVAVLQQAWNRYKAGITTNTKT